MSKLISGCCGKEMTIETWISKTKRKIYFCNKCKNPRRAVKKELVFVPPKESEGEKIFREYDQKWREEIIKGYPKKEAK